jgi:hypothetical protein
MNEEFETWWYFEGSQPPIEGHDCEEHCKRMCQIAWENGAYKALENPGCDYCNHPRYVGVKCKNCGKETK